MSELIFMPDLEPNLWYSFGEGEGARHVGDYYSGVSTGVKYKACD